jgi:hypothetical protein
MGKILHFNHDARRLLQAGDRVPHAAYRPAGRAAGDLNRLNTLRERRSGAGSLAGDTRAAKHYLSSVPARGGRSEQTDAVAKLKRVKRGLTLDLFLRRGGLWREVRVLREKWAVNAPVRVPERAEVSLQAVYPEHWEVEPGSKEWRESRPWRERYQVWTWDLDTLAYAVVPKPFDNLDYYLDTWRRFLGACVLYDPPETELLRFAAIGDLGPMPRGLHDLSPPFFPMVKQMRDWQRSASREHEEMWAVALEAVKRVAPPGTNSQEVLLAVMRERNGSRSRQEEVDEHNPLRWYIEVDEHATEKDVRQAFRMLRYQQGAYPQSGAPGRDPLVAVQAALLYDAHNGASGTGDRRRRKWTYKSLADHFGLGSPRSAKAHVEQGRRLLRAKPLP